MAKVVSITRISNNSKLYDIEVSETGNFFANNVLVHNSSLTMYYHDNVFGVCSRNLDLQETEGNSQWLIAREYDFESILKSIADELNTGVAIQGELVGPGIQGNKYKLPKLDFFAFQLYCVQDGVFVDVHTFMQMSERHNFKTVPIISLDFSLPRTVDELIAHASTKSMINSDIWQEGYVYRTHNSDISFKAINPNFLLKYNDD